MIASQPFASGSGLLRLPARCNAHYYYKNKANKYSAVLTTRLPFCRQRPKIVASQWMNMHYFVSFKIGLSAAVLFILFVFLCSLSHFLHDKHAYFLTENQCTTGCQAR